MWVGCVLKGDMGWVRLSISMVIGNCENEMRGNDSLDYYTGRKGWPIGCSPLMVALRQGPLESLE